MVHGGPGIKQDLLSEITNAKRAGSLTQTVECLPSKHKESPEFKPEYHQNTKINKNLLPHSSRGD
jgi:hypothetical protein